MMLINKDITPENNLYYTGSLVLDRLRQWDSDNVDILELYKKTTVDKEMSMKVFILSVDWLFILGLVDISKKGRVVKCF